MNRGCGFALAALGIVIFLVLIIGGAGVPMGQLPALVLQHLPRNEFPLRLVGVLHARD